VRRRQREPARANVSRQKTAGESVPATPRALRGPPIAIVWRFVKMLFVSASIHGLPEIKPRFRYQQREKPYEI
jgi:hypothetical protein